MASATTLRAPLGGSGLLASPAFVFMHKHRGLLIFGEGIVFSVFHDTYYLDAGSIPPLEISADAVGRGAKCLAGR